MTKTIIFITLIVVAVGIILSFFLVKIIVQPIDFHDGAVELQGVVNEVLQGIGIDIFAEEGFGYVESDVAELHGWHIVEEGLGQCVDALGHVEPAVFGKTLDNGFFKRCQGGFSVSAVVLHEFNV